MTTTVPIGSLASFWVVLKPTIKSTMADICFEATPASIGFLFIGGLACEDVYGFYLDEAVARDAAQVLLRALWPKGATLQNIDKKMTQHQHFYRSHDHVAALLGTFMEIQRSNNPFTKDEILELARKRPDVYGRFVDFVNKMPNVSLDNKSTDTLD